MRPGMRSKTLGKIPGKTERVTTSASQTCMQLSGTLETKMPLDHELLSNVENRTLPEQSRSGDQHRPAHRAAFAEDGPCPTEDSLLACVYIALRCSHCGELRQGLGELPQSCNVDCPECGRSCSFVLLGSGLTKKKLPFHEIHTGEQTRWERWSAEKNDSS